ncbi:protein disulfide-isomerase-like protein of the testis isoform X1 [Antechinus flavipes]|uniref:protein disulfide-isomerase-like protein of the testis isoform X1 n=2 Tax=Antechinus flavipes TaxID=38775 RepID=UPI002236AC13|nr:protein disulfide-isomerase-like protein of the testis isoform X1 [Antechinus flavipes]
MRKNLQECLIQSLHFIEERTEPQERRKMLLLRVIFLFSSSLSVAQAWGGWNFQNDRVQRLEALGIQEEKNLLVLTATTLPRVLNETRFLMVEFYNPLSKQSQNLIKEMGKAVDIMGKEKTGVLFGKVNITSEKLLEKEFAIKNVPTVKLFVEGQRQQPIDCRGVIEAAALVAWLRNQIRLSVVLLTSREQTKTFISSKKLSVIGFFEDLHEGTVELFYELVKDFPEVPFGLTEQRNVWILYGITIDTMVVFQQGTIVHFEECEEDRHILRDLSQIVKFFTMDLVIEYNIETMDQIYDMHIRNHILLFISKNSTEFGALVKTFESVAQEFKNKLIFLMVNTDQVDNTHVLEYFQITSWDIPGVRILNLTKNTRYRMPAEEITFKNMKKFCNNFLDGLAKQQLPSENIPKDWDTKPVKVLVGKNFKEVVFSHKRNVFVMFYAPWSYECKSLLPVLEELGKKYQYHESVTIAKIDITANDIQQTFLEKYPFFKFFPAKSDLVVPYNGEYSLNAFIDFVEKEIKSQMELEEWSFEEEESDEKEDLSLQDWKKTKEEL